MTNTLLHALLCSVLALGADLPNAFAGNRELAMRLASDGCFPMFTAPMFALHHQYFVCENEKYAAVSEADVQAVRNDCATLRVIGSGYSNDADYKAAFGATPSDVDFDKKVKTRVQGAVDAFVNTLPEGMRVIVQWDADKIVDAKGNKKNFAACLSGIGKALDDRLAGFYAVKRINTFEQFLSRPQGYTNCGALCKVDWAKELFVKSGVMEELVNVFEKPCWYQVSPVERKNVFAKSSMYNGDDWGAHVSHMLAANQNPHMVLALGGRGCVAEAQSGYAPGATQYSLNLMSNGKKEQMYSFTEARDTWNKM